MMASNPGSKTTKLEMAFILVIVWWVAATAVFAILNRSVELGPVGYDQAKHPYSNHLVINEVELSPSSGSQWVELYNPYISTISLQDMIIVFNVVGGEDRVPLDDYSSVPSHGFLKIKLTNLATSGSTITLLEEGGLQVDQVSPQVNDDRSTLSWQRFPDGGEQFSFRPATPGRSNGDNTWIFWLALFAVFSAPVAGLFMAGRKRYRLLTVGLCKWSREGPGAAQRTAKMESKMEKKRLARSQKSLVFLNWDASPGELEYIGLWLAILSLFGLILVCASIVVSPSLTALTVDFGTLIKVVLPLAALLPLVLYFYTINLPVDRAKLYRARAMGRMGEAIYYMTISMSLNPAIEKAVAFAAENLDPPLSDGLRSVLWRVHTRKFDTVEASLLAFADEWGEWNEDFKRALYAIVAAQGERTKEGMRFALQRANDIILEGTKSKLQTYAAKLSGPTMVLFAMGILLPLILGSMLPMAALGGLQLSLVEAILLMNVLFPSITFFYASRILRNRPEALTISIAKSHKGAARSFVNILLAAMVGVLLAGLLVFLKFITNPKNPQLDLVFGVAMVCGLVGGFGAYLLFLERERVKIRKQIQDLEDSFPDAVYQLGSLTGEGIPLEIALKKVADSVQKGSITKELRRWAYSMTVKRLPPEEVLFGPDGLLNDHPSRIVRSTMRMVAGSVQKDPSTAGRTIIGISGYLRDLKQVEHDVRTALLNTVSMMQNTALFFAPLVLAISIALYKILQQSLSGISVSAKTQLMNLTLGGGTSISLSDFSLVMGIYLALTALTISHFSSGIMSGDDPVERRHTIGQILPISMAVFGIVFVFSLTLFR